MKVKVASWVAWIGGLLLLGGCDGSEGKERGTPDGGQVQSGACARSAECAVGEACDAARGVCVPCTALDFCDPACPVGTSRCEGSVRVSCDARGGQLHQVCSLASTCVESLGGAECVPWVCPPGAVRCPAGSTGSVRCADDGLAEVPDAPCPIGQTCFNGQCGEPPCGADGGTCAVCAPGATECEGDGIRTCDASGQTYSDAVPCGQSQVCIGGACVDVACAPGTRECQSDAVRDCSVNGTAWVVVETCVAPAVCDASGGTPRCASVTCTPGAPSCDGDVLSTCNALGTGPEPGSVVDCAGTGQACFGSECRAVVCTGTSFCSAGRVQSCLDRGTATAPGPICTGTQYCAAQGTTASCEERVCTPGMVACQGPVISTCNPDGSGWTQSGADCSATGAACVNATCLPVVCTAGEAFCEGGNPYSCGAQGVSSTLLDTCLDSEFCSVAGATGQCSVDVCTAGSLTCRGNVAASCLADGSGPEPSGGTDCGAMVCEAGSCLPRVCDAGETFCLGGNVQQCNALGTAFTQGPVCIASTYCRDTGTTAYCSPDVCTPSTPTCSGEVAGTCSADGGNLEPGGTDCSAGSLICNEAAACAATAVDTLGGATNPGTSTTSSLRMNYVEVRVARRLVEIEQYVSVSGTSVFTWVVYRVGDGAEKVLEKTTSGSGTDGFQSSGPIDFVLDPFTRYYVGVYVSTPFTYSVAPTSTLEQLTFGSGQGLAFNPPQLAPTGPPPLRFQQNFGGVGFFSWNSYHQRLTTTMP